MSKLLKKSDSLKLFFVAAIMLAIPLYPKFPLVRLASTYVSIRLEDFLMLAVGLYIGAFVIKSGLVKLPRAHARDIFSPRFVGSKIPPKRKFLRIHPRTYVRGFLRRGIKRNVEKAIILFLFVGLASVISGAFVTKTLDLRLGLLHWARRIEYLVGFFFIVLVLKDSRMKILEFVYKLLGLTIALIFLVGLGQMYLNWPVIVTQNWEVAKGIALRYVSGGHLSSTFAGHYDMASYLVVGLPIIISFFFLMKKGKAKVTMGVIIFMGLWLLSNSLSRISVISYLGAVSVSLFILKKYKEIPLVIVVSLLVFGMSSNLLDRYIRIFQVTKERLGLVELVKPVSAQGSELIERRKTIEITPTPVPVFEDRSASIRLNVEWPRALRALNKNPILGTGYSSITLATDNDWLRMLGEVGLLGLASFLMIFAWLAKAAARVFGKLKKMENIERAYFAGFTGAVLGTFSNAMFIDIFEASKFAIIFWFLLGIYLNLLRRYEKA